MLLSAIGRTVVIAAVVVLPAGVLTSCAGHSGVAYQPPALAPAGSNALSPSERPHSPYFRTFGDGTTVHMYLPPSQRRQPDFPDHVVYNGGPIVQQSVTYAIFWRPRGTYMDVKYESVIEDFMHKVGNTTQYNTLTQYYDKKFGILNASSFGGAWTDATAYPSDFNHGRTGDRDLHDEVLKAIDANGWPHGGITPIYTVFTASKAPDDRWAACAYHASFTYNGVVYIYAIVPYQHDYGPHGCGTPSNVWPNDRDADQTIDTYWHEQAEATSDPITSGQRNGAWYSDVSGAEIGDLCQTSYGRIHPDGADTILHGQPFVTQEIWSNFNYHCVQHLRR